jgi:hypothetical protein
MYIRLSKVPSDLQEISKKAVAFYLEKFCHPRTVERLVGVKIKFMKFPKENEKEIAWCEYNEKNLRPVEFSLCFSDRFIDIRTREYLLTLFHELTHLRQYATGQLKDKYNGDQNWKGQVYPYESEYWMVPWELEAQGMELTAYQLFVAAYPEFGLKRFRKTYQGRSKSSWMRKQKVEIKRKSAKKT